MATTVTLEGSVRTGRGKGAARKMRMNRRIPGVLYGRNREPVLLDLDEKAFGKLVGEHSASNLIVDLTVGGGGDVVKTLILEVEIPIELVGVPTGVKNSGGILQHPVRTLAIKCLPHDMPDKITLDVTGLEIGDSIIVSSLTLENVEILADPDTSLATVVHPAKAEEPTPAEAAEAPAEPEVVGKKTEEEAGEAKDEKGD
jgi:large subunit ribosomal protein L25